MEYYSAIEKNEMLQFEDIMLNQINQTNVTCFPLMLELKVKEQTKEKECLCVTSIAANTVRKPLFYIVKAMFKNVALL